MLLLSQGRTAEIYAWGDDQVLKLFRDWCPEDWVEYEARIAQAVYAAGIPSPQPGEIIRVQGRRGLLYERLDGISMLQDMNARPWMLLRHARSLAELQVQIHRQSITGLPAYKDRLHYDILNATQLDENLRAKTLQILATLPDGQNLCHGDYHPGNVLITTRGTVIIDWMTACAGSPWADVARTSLIFRVGARAAGRQVHPVLRTIVRLFHRLYLNRYGSLNPDTRNELRRWQPVIAAARLSENIIPEREALIKIVNEGVKEQTASR